MQTWMLKRQQDKAQKGNLHVPAPSAQRRKLRRGQLPMMLALQMVSQLCRNSVGSRVARLDRQLPTMPHRPQRLQMQMPEALQILLRVAGQPVPPAAKVKARLRARPTPEPGHRHLLLHHLPQGRRPPHPPHPHREPYTGTASRASLLPCCGPLQRKCLSSARRVRRQVGLLKRYTLVAKTARAQPSLQQPSHCHCAKCHSEGRYVTAVSHLRAHTHQNVSARNEKDIRMTTHTYLNFSSSQAVWLVQRHCVCCCNGQPAEVHLSFSWLA